MSSLRQLDSESLLEDLTFTAYSVGVVEGELPDSHAATLQRLSGWGIPISPYMATVSGVQACESYYEQLAESEGETCPLISTGLSLR